MNQIQCSRCKETEYIPTHQFIKFDDKINYLCSGCWYCFKEWFKKGKDIQKYNEENK